MVGYMIHNLCGIPARHAFMGGGFMLFGNMRRGIRRFHFCFSGKVCRLCFVADGVRSSGVLNRIFDQ